MKKGVPSFMDNPFCAGDDEIILMDFLFFLDEFRLMNFRHQNLFLTRNYTMAGFDSYCPDIVFILGHKVKALDLLFLDTQSNPI